MVAKRDTTAGSLFAARCRSVHLKERLTEAAGGMLTMQEVSRRFGLSPQCIEKALHEKRLIADEKAGVRRLSACQFVDRGILNGLPDALSALPVVGFWSRLSFLVAGLPEAGYRTPIEALRASKAAEVVYAARRYGEHEV